MNKQSYEVAEGQTILQACQTAGTTYEMGITHKRLVRTRKEVLKKDDSSLSLVCDPEKCILCGPCVAVCSEMQTVKAIDFAGRGVKTHESFL